jgi:hypothetical protein
MQKGTARRGFIGSVFRWGSVGSLLLTVPPLVLTVTPAAIQQGRRMMGEIRSKSGGAPGPQHVLP